MSVDYRKYETSYGLMVLFIMAGNVFQGGTLILLIGKKKVRNLWRSWWYSFTGKCKPPRSKELQTSTSVQELEPSKMKEKEPGISKTIS